MKKLKLKLKRTTLLNLNLNLKTTGAAATYREDRRCTSCC